MANVHTNKYLENNKLYASGEQVHNSAHPESSRSIQLKM